MLLRLKFFSMTGHAPQTNLVPLTFELGKILITEEALEYIDRTEALKGLSRHVSEGCDSEDELEKLHDVNILSIYTAANGIVYWIITEGDRSATTVLLPHED